MMSDSLLCPVHPGCHWSDLGRLFEHNIRLRPGEQGGRSPKPGYGFIYKITHVSTGMCFVGQAKYSLSQRWSGHRAYAKMGGDPLHRAMKEEGLHMFVMEELEECGRSIIDERELDFMRELDSWNPKIGYNKPCQNATYARKLFFLLNPGKEEELMRHRNSPMPYIEGGWDSLSQEQKRMEDPLGINEIALREGKKLMTKIASLASPVIFACLPEEVD